jgi:hypothetical protein
MSIMRTFRRALGSQSAPSARSDLSQKEKPALEILAKVQGGPKGVHHSRGNESPPRVEFSSSPQISAGVCLRTA